MASEEDNFDIDIYGDGGEDYGQEVAQEEIKADDNPNEAPESMETIPTTSSVLPPNGYTDESGVKQETQHEGSDGAQKIASTDQSAQDPVHLPKQAPQTQGLKRKDGADDRFVDPGATSALFVSELHWWINDDDVRGWANQSQCEDELEEITFSEHKVNGKSKGQAYVLFKSPQAATATKQKIETLGDGQHSSKKFTISYTNPYTNPFKTLPKDGPMRNNNTTNNNRGAYGGAGAGGQNQNSGYNNTGGYRGNRGGGYNRGGMNNMSGFNRGGYQQPMTGGFQGSSMGFQGSAMGMQPYGGFQGRGAVAGGMRGGAMGMRGGRGGMNNGMMGLPMGGMSMGAMGMAMPQMGGALAMQGMPGSYNQPYVKPTAPYGSSAVPPGSSAYITPVIRQFSPSGSVGSPAPLTLGGSVPRPSSSPGTAWASYTQYSSPPTNSPADFTSQAPAPGGSFTPLQSTTLKLDSSMTGNQAHFNPAFFPLGHQAGGDASWNPHGAKRTRQE